MGIYWRQDLRYFPGGMGKNNYGQLEITPEALDYRLYGFQPDGGEKLVDTIHLTPEEPKVKLSEIELRRLDNNGRVEVRALAENQGSSLATVILPLWDNQTLHVNMGLKFKSTTSEPSWVAKAGAGKISSSYKYSSEKNKIKLEAANVSKEFNKNLKLIAGTQKAEIGEGLWLSKGAINAFTAQYKFTPQDQVTVLYGRDSQDYLVNDIAQDSDPASQTRLLKYIDYTHHFTKDAFAGVYFGSQQPERYIGVYGEAPLTGKWWVAGEYVRNTNSDKPAMDEVRNVSASAQEQSAAITEIANSSDRLAELAEKLQKAAAKFKM